MTIADVREKYGEWCTISHAHTKYSLDLEEYAHVDFIWIVYVPVNVSTVVAVYESDASGKIGDVLFEGGTDQ